MQKFYLFYSISLKYEWLHRGSAHIHDFIWIGNAANVDNLDWMNESRIATTMSLFDTYVIDWNPRSLHQINLGIHRLTFTDPYLLTKNGILASSQLEDYEELVNYV